MKRELDFVPVSTTDVEERMIVLRQQPVLLDCDVAALYGVKTKEINQAVRNNPNKFPTGYVFLLCDEEKGEVVKIFDRLSNLKYSTAHPTAFTERGLYMLATILKSERAVNGRNLNTNSTETEIELNFAVVKIKHKVIRNDIP